MLGEVRTCGSLQIISASAKPPGLPHASKGSNVCTALSWCHRIIKVIWTARRTKCHQAMMDSGEA